MTKKDTAPVTKYLKAVIKVADSQGVGEHSYRTPFQALLDGIIKSKDKRLGAIHEATELFQNIRPDFTIRNKHSLATIGYIECKDIDADLEKEVGSAQLKKYSELNGNILLTNYLNFIWMEEVVRLRLSHCIKT